MDSETEETQNKTIESKSNVILVNGASQEIEDIDWLWKGWLAKGKFHLLAGAPGTGKTMLALNMAATVTRGGKWPDKSDATLGRVLIWSGEDHINDTLLPRLVVAGADVNRIEFIDKVNEFNRIRPFDFKTDITQLSQKIKEINGCSLLIIDSIVQAVAGDSNKNTSVRNALNPLVELGIYYNCAILGITHVNKRSAKHAPLDRVTGSLAFSAVARIILMTDKIQSEVEGSSSDAVLVRVKTNIGECNGGFEYGIQEIEFEHNGKKHKNSTISWCDEPLKGTASNILKFADSDKSSVLSVTENKAIQFLKAELANGDRKSTELLELAHKQEISSSSLNKAKKTLGVQAKKLHGTAHGQWINSLPENESMQVGVQIQTHQQTKPNEPSQLTVEERKKLKERCIINHYNDPCDNVTYLKKLTNPVEISIYFQFMSNEMLADTIHSSYKNKIIHGEGFNVEPILSKDVTDCGKKELEIRVNKEKFNYNYTDSRKIVETYKSFYSIHKQCNRFIFNVFESVLLDRKFDISLVSSSAYVYTDPVAGAVTDTSSSDTD